MISVSTIWCCPCVEMSLVLLEKMFSMTRVFSWKNSLSLCSASFCTPRTVRLVYVYKFSFWFSIGKDKFHCFCDILDDYGQYVLPAPASLSQGALRHRKKGLGILLDLGNRWGGGRWWDRRGGETYLCEPSGELNSGNNRAKYRNITLVTV